MQLKKEIELTHEKIREILKSAHHNRQLREERIIEYALLMKFGHWKDFHPQGILFDDNGRLLDGQHRLMAALRVPNYTLKVVAWYGCDRDAMIKTVDKGRAKSICNSLDMIFGSKIKYKHNIPSIAAQIITVAMGSEQKNNYYNTILVYNLYKEEINKVMENVVIERRLASSLFLAAFVLGVKINEDKTMDFQQKYFTGEGIYKEDPVYKFRKRVMEEKRSIRHVRHEIFRLCLTALRCHIEDKPMKRVVVDDGALFWFEDQQKREMDAIRKKMSLNII